MATSVCFATVTTSWRERASSWTTCASSFLTRPERRTTHLTSSDPRWIGRVKPVRLNFISDIATPHVNELLRPSPRDPTSSFGPGIPPKRPGMYSWKTNPTHEVVPARVFGERRPSIELLRHALTHGDEAYVIVGWSNPTTKLLVPAFAMAGRPFGFFTDHPDDDLRPFPRRVARNAYFEMLKRSATVFAVGKRTVDYFVKRGFDPEKVCNLPMPIAQRTDLAELSAARTKTRRQYGAADGNVFVVTGSRLIHEKGFDILLNAIGELNPDERSRMRLLIVGSGPPEELKSLAAKLGLSELVTFAPWMEFGDFARCMAAADVVISGTVRRLRRHHPHRHRGGRAGNRIDGRGIGGRARRRRRQRVPLCARGSAGPRSSSALLSRASRGVGRHGAGVDFDGSSMEPEQPCNRFDRAPRKGRSPRMKKLPPIIAQPGQEGVRLRAAEETDKEVLRVWKNENEILLPPRRHHACPAERLVQRVRCASRRPRLPRRRIGGRRVGHRRGGGLSATRRNR